MRGGADGRHEIETEGNQVAGGEERWAATGTDVQDNAGVTGVSAAAHQGRGRVEEGRGWEVGQGLMESTRRGGEVLSLIHI